MKIILLVFLFCSITSSGEAYESYSPGEILTLLGKAKVGSEMVFVDVRSGVKRSVIPQSIEIPLDKIVGNCLGDPVGSGPCPLSKEILNRPLVVYCQKGMRSTKAARMLEDMGAKEIINMDGGIDAWRKAGGPVEKRLVTTPLWPGGTCEINIRE